ncbi:hypothetical protein [Streptomyces alfalfae]
MNPTGDARGRTGPVARGRAVGRSRPVPHRPAGTACSARATLAASEAAADAKLAAAREQIAQERAAEALKNVGLEGATFGGSIVLGDQYGVTGGIHHGDVYPGHPDDNYEDRSLAVVDRPRRGRQYRPTWGERAWPPPVVRSSIRSVVKPGPGRDIGRSMGRGGLSRHTS